MILLDEGRPTLATGASESITYTDVYEWGRRLAETPLGVKPAKGALWEAKGWKEFVSGMDESKQPIAAIMLENCRRQFGKLDEVTRTQNLGTFDKWIFPIIANMSENDTIDEMVSLQPMAGPTSQIVYMDIVTSQRKGNIPAGSAMWRAQQGASDRYMDSDELVQDEPLGSTDASGAISGTVDYFPLRAGVFSITVGAVVMQDDGNGTLVPATGSSTGTINYATGEYAVTGATASTVSTATYAYDSEANSNIQGYEMRLTSSPVAAKVMKLKTKWTEEASQNLQAMYNVKAESVLLTALSNALQYQKHRQVINDLRVRADAGLVTWNAVPPANVNYQTHKFTIVDSIMTGSMFIQNATNMVTGNWILTGLQLATALYTLPTFIAKGSKTKVQGLTYQGDIGNMKVFVDPHYPVNEFMVGYKGDDFMSTGYVLAEYQKLYTTPNIVLPDFVNQRGFATSFAKKMINPKMFARGLVLNSPVSFGGA